MPHCLVIKPGIIDYSAGIELQKHARELVVAGKYDGCILLLEEWRQGKYKT